MSWWQFGRDFGLLLLVFIDGSNVQAQTFELLVPSRVIQAGELVLETDLSAKVFEVTPTGAANYVMSVAQIKGKEARRALPIGRPIANSSLGPTVLVRKGQSVEARFRAAGIVIEMPLIALENGFEGSVVTSRNTATGKHVRARVAANGTLEVLK